MNTDTQMTLSLLIRTHWQHQHLVQHWEDLRLPGPKPLHLLSNHQTLHTSLHFRSRLQTKQTRSWEITISELPQSGKIQTTLAELTQDLHRFHRFGRPEALETLTLVMWMP